MAINRTPQIWIAPDTGDANRLLSQGGMRELDLLLITSVMSLYIMNGGSPQLISSKNQMANVPAITDNSTGTGAAGGTLAAITLGSQITDNTGGSATTTLAAIAAGASYTQADMVAVKNALASLAAANNQDTTQITPIKNAIAVLAAEINAIRGNLVGAGFMVGP